MSVGGIESTGFASRGRTGDAEPVAVIELLGLRATGFHGVLDQERNNGQEFSADVRLTVREPSEDELEQTVNYATVATEVAAIISGPPVNLIETLAVRIAERCLAFPGVFSAQITVHKPNAPVDVVLGDIMVTVNRRN